MTGFLALLDDIATIAKMAAVHIDDVSTLAAKAGVKSAGVVIDDAAVTPKYVRGLPAARELPIVLKIARGSLFNKLVILLPAAMLINAFAPFMLTPLLMLGGLYLSFEGTEKVLHSLFPHHGAHEAGEAHAEPVDDPEHIENERVAGAIKTDFVLSAEITAIALAAIEADSLWKEGAVLALVAVGITALVYGSVALLVKADDIGLRMHEAGRLKITRAAGRRIVKAMPSVIAFIAIVGTAAMLWVGGSILSHGMKDLGFAAVYDAIHHAADGAAGFVPFAGGLIGWLVTVVLDAGVALVLGALTIAAVTFAVSPALKRLRRKRKPAAKA